MIRLPLAWTLWMVSLWTAGSCQILLQEPVKVQYPPIGRADTIECDCGNASCDTVYWFHSIYSLSRVRFIGKHNNADRHSYGDGVDKTWFKFSKKGSTAFVLRINNVTEDDRGFYSCVLKDKSNTEIWRPGVLLRPGETPPTPPPKTKPKPPVKTLCRCPKKNPSPVGCSSLVLWPLAGLTAGLVLALVCTLYYFSRLPKKCHHHFVNDGCSKALHVG